MSKAVTEIEISEANKYYWKRARCQNCGFSETLGFIKGEKVEQAGCPNCELIDLMEI